MLLALDGSLLAEKAIPAVLSLARLGGAHITLLRVVEPAPVLFEPSPLPPPVPVAVGPAALDSAVEEARSYLQEIARRLGALGMRARLKVAVSPHAAEEILAQARSGRVDLIALATHGRGGLARMLVGSVADKVVRGAHVPVLVVRPEEEAGEPAGRAGRASAAYASLGGVAISPTGKRRRTSSR